MAAKRKGVKSQRSRAAIWAADLECTTDPEDCRVWAFGCEEIHTHEQAIGSSLTGLMNWLHSVTGIVYFHNLAYDGRFIIDALLRSGYRWVSDRVISEGEFTTMISDDNKFYRIDLPNVQIRDSLKILPMSIKAMAKAFKLPVQKGECDYDKYRAPGEGLASNDINYLMCDVHILALSLVDIMNMRADKLTIGSSAMSQYKETVPFDTLYPKLGLAEDEFVRRSYRGGFVYVNPLRKNCDLGEGMNVDYNSMYPSMLLANPFPIREGVYFSENYHTQDLFVIRMICELHLRPNKAPFIPDKAYGRFATPDYVTDTVEPISLTLTSVDLALLYECYEVEIVEWQGGYEYESANNLFTDYIDHWRHVKESSEGGIRTIAKLFLNSLYGKFGTSPESGYRYPYLDDDGNVEYEIVSEDRDPVYIPVATFTTSYARRELVQAINANFDRFIYCDTDSIYMVGRDDPDLKLDDNMFGYWKVEKHFSRARFLRAKTYIVTTDDGANHITCAGMTQAIKENVTWENFHFGFSNLDDKGEPIPGWDKLMPKVVKGGVVLKRAKFMLKC